MKYLLIHKDLWSAVEDEEGSVSTRDGKGTDDNKSDKAKALVGLNVADFHLQTVEEGATCPGTT